MFMEQGDVRAHGRLNGSDQSDDGVRSTGSINARWGGTDSTAAGGVQVESTTAQFRIVTAIRRRPDSEDT